METVMETVNEAELAMIDGGNGGYGDALACGIGVGYFAALGASVLATGGGAAPFVAGATSWFGGLAAGALIACGNLF